MDHRFRAEIVHAKIRLCRSSIDDEKRGPALAAYFHFHLACGPDSAVVTESEISELFYHARAFPRLFRVHRKPYGLVEPCSLFGIMGAIDWARRALHHVAVARATTRRIQFDLHGPEVLWFQKIFVAERTA